MVTIFHLHCLPKWRPCFILYVLWTSIAVPSLHAQEAPLLELHSTDEPLEAVSHISVLLSSEESLSTILQSNPSFTPLAETPRTRLPKQEYFWLKIQLTTGARAPPKWYMLLPFAEASGYLIYDSTRIALGRTGSYLPPTERALQLGLPPQLFLEVAPGKQATVYLRGRYNPKRYGFNAKDLNLLRFVPAPVWHRSTTVLRFFYGTFFGIMLAMVLYNLFLVFSFRDTSYLYYVFGTLFIAIFFTEGLGLLTDNLWPQDWPIFPEVSFYSLLLALGFSLQFYRVFLDTKRFTPRLDRLLVYSIALTPVPILITFFGWWPLAENAAALLCLVSLCISFGAGVFIWRQAYRPAQFYMIATSLLLLGSIIYILTWFGVFPVNGFTRHSVLVGKALETILFSLGLADRINQIQAEKQQALQDAAQKDALAATLQERDVVKTQLLNMASHDLKSPLQGILGFTEVLRDEVGKDSPLNEPLSVMHLAAENMLDLVHNLLNTTALESGKIILDEQDFDIAELVLEITQAHRPLAQRKNQALSVDVPPTGDFLLTGDRNRLREVISNLVNNAIKYSPLGSPVAITLEHHTTAVHIKVSDKGPGLSEHDQTKLFQPFQRLSSLPTGNESSTGLGLAIAKRLVDLHHGEIQVATQLGEGSTFSVILPTVPRLNAQNVPPHEAAKTI